MIDRMKDENAQARRSPRTMFLTVVILFDERQVSGVDRARRDILIRSGGIAARRR
jgi:hypothetical protein